MAESNNKKESANVIDFTAAKLKQLVKHYGDLGQLDVAIQIEECLMAYEDGDVTVVWQGGLPYIKLEKQS
tara:strand:- start:10321 stop:10530 length:210 start_codon:yes stop_codon:yes gene_type:complete